MATRDAFDADLAGLRAYDADPERIERIRARSVAVLAARRRREQARLSRRTPWPRWIEPAVAFGLGVLYLTAAFQSSLALLR